MFMKPRTCLIRRKYALFKPIMETQGIKTFLKKVGSLPNDKLVPDHGHFSALTAMGHSYIGVSYSQVIHIEVSYSQPYGF